MKDPESLYPEEGEEWEEEGEGEESEEGDAVILCPVCGSPSVRLIEAREEGGFYECGGCGATFEEQGPY